MSVVLQSDPKVAHFVKIDSEIFSAFNLDLAADSWRVTGRAFWTIEALKNGTQAVISDGEIKTLYKDLCSGRVKSGRMHLWHNPGVSLKLKQRLKPLMFHFADTQVDELTERISSCSGIDKLTKKGEFQFLDLVFDVLVPEVTIKVLEKWEGMNTYTAEKAMLQQIHLYPK